MTEDDLPVIKVVGLSAAGKSTLVRALREAGYNARSVTQEHSGIPDLWRQFETTHALIYLEVSWEVQRTRRDEIGWSESTRRSEIERLAHAREHADLIIDTSSLTSETVCRVALAWLRQRDAPKRLRLAD